MHIHLFYRTKGVLRKTFIETEEEVITYSDENVIPDLLKLFKEPYKYESRIDFKINNNDESYFIRRNCDDIKNGVFDVTFSPMWNCHNSPEKMNSKALKKILIDKFHAETNGDRFVESV